MCGDHGGDGGGGEGEFAGGGHDWAAWGYGVGRAEKAMFVRIGDPGQEGIGGDHRWFSQNNDASIGDSEEHSSLESGLYIMPIYENARM